MDSSNIIDKIKNEFLNNKDKILEIIDLEKKNWDYDIDFDKLLGIFDKYENKESVINNDFKNTKEFVSGIGRVAFINQTNPYSILSMILISIRTDNDVVFFLKDKLLAINTILVEIARKVSDRISHINSNTYEDFYSTQEKYDCVVYFGNKFEYLDFSRRVTIKSIFENSNEIYVFIDDRSFKDEFMAMDKFAYYNDINIRYYSEDFENSIKKINDFGVLKNAAIYTKDRQKAFEFLQKVKAENVYVNTNPCKNYEFDFDESKLVFMKKMC
ncbi:MAG: hypothetical protein IKG42_03715 [Clostridia bacterium]|nr:hypothetical protein [Clostridia bacterium]